MILAWVAGNTNRDNIKPIPKLFILIEPKDGAYNDSYAQSTVCCLLALF